MKRVIVYSLLLIAGMGFSPLGFAEAWPEATLFSAVGTVRHTSA